MQQSNVYESWLAKQEAMGRRVPATTAEYRPPCVECAGGTCTQPAGHAVKVGVRGANAR